MGLEELSAYYHVSRRLEEAIAAGTARPGRSGWKRRQQGIAAAALSEQSPRARSWRDVIESERIDHWARLGGDAHRELARDIAPRLAAPVPLPPDAAARVEPLRWLLERAGDDGGLLLTQKHNLARRVVAAAVLRFPAWATPWAGRNETDLPELHEARTWVAAVDARSPPPWRTPPDHRRGPGPARRYRLTVAGCCSHPHRQRSRRPGRDRSCVRRGRAAHPQRWKAEAARGDPRGYCGGLRGKGWRNALTGEPVSRPRRARGRCNAARASPCAWSLRRRRVGAWCPAPADQLGCRRGAHVRPRDRRRSAVTVGGGR